MVTKQEWLTDIANTEKEMEAYKKLSEGFATLANLPENQGAQSNLFYHKSQRYKSSYENCNKFYIKLKGLDQSKLEDK